MVIQQARPVPNTHERHPGFAQLAVQVLLQGSEQTSGVREEGCFLKAGDNSKIGLCSKPQFNPGFDQLAVQVLLQGHGGNGRPKWKREMEGRLKRP